VALIALTAAAFSAATISRPISMAERRLARFFYEVVALVLQS